MATLAEGRKAVACSRPLDPKSTQSLSSKSAFPRGLALHPEVRFAWELGRLPLSILSDVQFDCGWSLLNHGVADTKRLNLGNLNPIYERELTKLELHQGEGRWSVSKNGARGRGCRHK